MKEAPWTCRKDDCVEKNVQDKDSGPKMKHSVGRGACFPALIHCSLESSCTALWRLLKVGWGFVREQGGGKAAENKSAGSSGSKQATTPHRTANAVREPHRNETARFSKE